MLYKLKEENPIYNKLYKIVVNLIIIILLLLITLILYDYYIIKSDERILEELTALDTQMSKKIIKMKKIL